MVSNPMFPMLEEMIDRRGIKVSVICKKVGISEKSFHNKRIGRSEFTWKEIREIQTNFFPDIDKNILFSESPPTTTSKT